MNERVRIPSHRVNRSLAAGQDFAHLHHADRPSNLQMLSVFGLRAKLTVSQPSDPDEREADSAADAFSRGQAAASGKLTQAPADRVQRQCADCDEPIMREAAAGETRGPSPSAVIGEGAGGHSLPRSTRAPYERFFNADLGNVRVHDDSAAHKSAASLNANAFSRGSDIYFAKGQFSPETSSGQHLLAHELTHTLQRPAPATLKRDASPLPANAAIYSVADEVLAAVRIGDVNGVVSRLHPRSVIELRAIRDRVSDSWFGTRLEKWLLGKVGAAKQRGSDPFASVAKVLDSDFAAAEAKAIADGPLAEEGIRWLWPALPLIDKLEFYDEGYREIEQAQVDVICHEPTLDVQDAWNNPASKEKLLAVFEKMDAREEYKARKCIDGSTKGLIEIAVSMLGREAMDAVADAILALPPGDRERFVRFRYKELYDAFRKKPIFSGNILEYLEGMARPTRVDHKSFGGSEADAIVARLLIAIEGHTPDDKAGVDTAVDHAVEVLAERSQLQEKRRSAKITSEAELTRIDDRLGELSDLDRLFYPDRSRFIDLVAEARPDQGAFFADMQRLMPYAGMNAVFKNAFALAVAKKRVKMADDDPEALREILLTTHATVDPAPGAKPDDIAKEQAKATEEMRKDVMATMPYLPDSKRRGVKAAVEGGPYDLIRLQLNQAKNGAQWGTLFSLVIRVSRDPSLTATYNSEERAKAGTSIGAAGIHAQLPREVQRIVEAILDHADALPLAMLLEFSGKPDVLKPALASMPEGQRARLRKGWALARGLRAQESKEEKDKAGDGAARTEFNELEIAIRKSVGDDEADIQEILAAALGSVPAAAEVATGEGRYAAGLMMWERIVAGEKLERGASTEFTEADEAMDGAARQFAAMWMPIAERGTKELSGTELAMLTSFYQLYVERHEDFKEASNSIGEFAGMIAATVAAMVVIAATGGTATPLVVAAAAASGAGARVLTREMFGADYYRALSDAGFRDALLGSVDAALAVVGGGLAAKGAELLGVSGEALVAGAARAAGEVAEEATLSLSQKVLAGSVEGAIDGLFSGAVSESFSAMTDDNTWRMGIMKGLVRVGHAAVLGGLMGAVGGGVMGGAMPIIGSGLKSAWRGIAGKTIESSAERAGKTTALKAARDAAEKGDWENAYKFADDVASGIDHEEAIALRDELKKTLSKDAAKNPHGTAKPHNDHQKKLLSESGKSDELPTGEHLEAERDIVERSAPQPTDEPGYVEEVNLGNGHSWKRKADGGWCRFSGKAKGCGSFNRSEGPKKTWLAAREQADLAHETAEKFSDIKAKVAAAPRKPNGKLNFDVPPLSKAERETLEQALAAHPDSPIGKIVGEKDLEDITLQDLNKIESGGPFDPALNRRKSLLEIEAANMTSKEKGALDAYINSLTDPYEKLRSASPNPDIRQKIRRRSQGLDEVSGRPPINQGVPDADHVYPLRSIWDNLKLEELPFPEQKAIANNMDNFKAVDSGINRSRQNKSWRSDFSGRGTYTQDELTKIIELEDRMRKELKDLVNDRRQALGMKKLP